MLQAIDLAHGSSLCNSSGSLKGTEKQKTADKISAETKPWVVAVNHVFPQEGE